MRTASYRQAIIDTFLHQSDPQKVAVLRGALKIPSLEGNTILDHLRSSPDGRLLARDLLSGQKNWRDAADPQAVARGRLSTVSDGGLDVGAFLKAISPANVYGGSGKGSGGSPATLSPMFGGGAAGLQTVKNFGKDAVNFIPNTVQGLYGVGDQLVQGHVGNAFHMLTDQYVQAFEHPGTFVKNHPLYALTMAGGPEAAVGRGVGAITRSGVLGDAVKQAGSTARAPLRLGPDIAGAPSPLLEARSYSPNLAHKGIQVARENRLKARGLDPNVARPKLALLPRPVANSLNIGLQAKTERLADEAVAIHRQMKGREDRQNAIQTGILARPHKTVENIVPHILQNIVRPGSEIADLTKERARLISVQTGNRTSKEFANRAQVRDLSRALKNPEHIPEAVAAADALRPYLHAQDAYAVDKGIIDPHQAVRARSMVYEQAHHGATYDYKGGQPTAEAVAFKQARMTERTAGRAVRDQTAAVAQARRQHDVVMARLNATRGPSRGTADLRGNPLPRAAAERVSQVQTRLVNAQDALAKARKEFLASRSSRVKLQPHAGEAHGPGFVDASGNPLHTQTILDHLKAEKLPDPAFVSHLPAKQAPWRFYQAWKGARGHLKGQTRTGEAFRSGGWDHTYNGLIAQMAHTQEGLTKAGFHDYLVSRFGIKKPTSLQTGSHENGYFTAPEAQKYALSSRVDDHGNPIPGAQPLVPMTAFNAKTPLSVVEHLQSPADLKHVDGLELDAIKRAMADAAERKDSTRNVVLVPEHALNQLTAQFKPAGDIVRKFGQVSQQFKRTVLPYSTHWMGQIATEAVIRGVIAGVIDPRNIIAGQQMMRRLTKTEEGRAALREMVNAHFYNKSDPLMKFNPNPSPTLEAIRGLPIVGDKTIPLPGGRPIPRTLVAKVRGKELPPPRDRYVPGLMGAHNLYADKIGQAMGGLEHQFRIMGLGKLSRQQLQEFTGSYQAGVRLQGKNLDLLASKLTTDPALVAKFGRQIDDIFGKYNKLSPSVRAAVQSIAPFLPWYLNAAKFVLWNLPVKHPVANSLLASLQATIAQDIQDGKGQPLNQYQEEALARVSPWGILPQSRAEEGGPLGKILQVATGAMLPEASGAYNALLGRNVFGDQSLKGPGGTVKAYTGPARGAALEALTEAILPGTSKLRQGLEGGGTAYGTSTLINPQPKPGTSGGLAQILDRLFYPLRGFRKAGGYKSKGSGGSGANPFAGKTTSNVNPFAGKTTSNVNPFK